MAETDLSAKLISEAEKLEQAAYKLREAAAVLGGPAANGKPVKSVASAKVSRLEQLTAFLKANGPMARKDVKRLSGIPSATAGALLNKKNFAQDDDGRWHVKA